MAKLNGRFENEPNMKLIGDMTAIIATERYKGSWKVELISVRKRDSADEEAVVKCESEEQSA